MAYKAQLRRARAHWSRRAGYRRLFGSFVLVFGTLWLFLEPVSLTFPDLFDRSWGLLAGLVFLSAVAALWRSRPKNELQFTLPPTDVRIGVKIGNVLRQEGNVVIGSNDVFDTDLSDEIISPDSVQGQLLLEIFEGNRHRLDEEIRTSLVGVSSKTDVEKAFGKRQRYPVGTVAVVQPQKTRYFLPAIARMSAATPPHVVASVEGVQTALTRAWESVGRAGQREPVHAPIIGSHLARLGLSRTWIVQMMVLSFVAVAKKDAGSNSLTIWVSPPDAEDVDFAALDDWLRALCAA